MRVIGQSWLGKSLPEIFKMKLTKKIIKEAIKSALEEDSVLTEKYGISTPHEAVYFLRQVCEKHANRPNSNFARKCDAALDILEEFVDLNQEPDYVSATTNWDE